MNMSWTLLRHVVLLSLCIDAPFVLICANVSRAIYCYHMYVFVAFGS